ncbi:MAG: methyltransferase domain-containing protein [Woeseiaceae bacterium]
MSHDNEYHDNMVTMLELIWGEGYMAPGGAGNIGKLLHGTDPDGKRILDIGCGIGGPAFEMARSHGAEVTGIDLEAPLIDRARAAAVRHGLDDRCHFQVVDTGPLPFADASFDIVVSSGAITQTDDKHALLSEASRVLRPGGYMTCYEWLKSDAEISDDMRYWLRLEGLTYALETLQQLEARFLDAGFTEVTATDASDWYRREARREYALIKGELYERVVELLGADAAEHFVEDWRAMTVVCDAGEMRQGYCRGRLSAL